MYLMSELSPLRTSDDPFDDKPVFDKLFEGVNQHDQTLI